MKYELMNPEYIVYSLIIIIIIMFAWKKKDNYKKGIIVANTKYVKNTGYYKRIMVKYRVYSIFAFICCISLIILGGVLSSRIFVREKKEELGYNRDIIFCVDGEDANWNGKQFVGAMKDIISGLKNERIGIVAFNTSAVTVLPLTTSYTYALEVLDRLYDEAVRYRFSEESLFVNIGTKNKGTGTLTGDGIASCAMTFKQDEKRTKIIILFSGIIETKYADAYMTVPEAGDVCKDAGIVVYPISWDSACMRDDLSVRQYKELAAKTGGKYYDLLFGSSQDVISEINSLSKSMLKKTVSTSKIDIPELIFRYLVIITGVMFVVDWRIRI